MSSPDALEQSNSGPDGLTLAAYAAAKGLAEDELRGHGLGDITYERRPAVRMPYR